MQGPGHDGRLGITAKNRYLSLFIFLMIIYVMSLEKKVIISFLISAAVIAFMALAGYLNFIEIRKEIRYLELSDSVRSKTLQLRRHEKNFFLYGDSKEVENVHEYLRDLGDVIKEASPRYKGGKLLALESELNEYSRRFDYIVLLSSDFQKEFGRKKPSYRGYASFFPMIEATALERPLVSAELLERVFPSRTQYEVRVLRELNAEIVTLRKEGEEILTLSKDLDKSAREKVERAISMSQTAALVFFPLFLLSGLGALFVISHSVVKRLKLLTAAIEKTGSGDFSSLELPTKHDEVGVLINSFNKMEADLIKRDDELHKKNEELLQSKKLASVGTLASGVAHELNNPLNNIYLAAQVLAKEIDEENCPPMIRETVGDIFSQTLRVKRIVGDLLEFARKKPPELREVELSGIIRDVLNQARNADEASAVRFELDIPEGIRVNADRHLLEQVFVNLFGNAIEAMESGGVLRVEAVSSGGFAKIVISDTGKGIAPQELTRIFDPFYTTKEKGTGLGLAIVYNTIEKHNGKIEVKSELSRGTKFTITLPEVK